MPTKQTISLSIRISCALIVLSAALLIASPAQAATVTWDGGGGDNNWSTGANWDTGSAPTDADDVVLDATSTKDMTIDGDYTVNSFSMNSGYTGTVTQASGSDLVTDSTDFTVNAGTFTMVSDSTVTSQLDVNIGGGTFNAAGTTYLRRDWNETSGTFSHSNGTVQTVDSPQSDFDVPTSANFYNLTITKASGSDFAVATGDTINVTNTLSLSQGDLTGSGTLDAEGALSFDTGWTGGSGNLTITGAATRSTDLEDTITLPDNVTINAANFTLNGAPSGNVTGGTITLTSGTLALNSGSLTLTDSSVGLLIQGGTLTAGGGNIDLSAGSFQMTSGTFTGSTGNLDTDEDFTLSGGTFTAPTGTLYVKDDWTHTGGGTFTHNNGTVEAYGNVQATFDVASTESFYNFTVNKDNGTQMIVASGDTLTAANQLTLTDGNLNTGTFNTENLLSNGTNFDGGTGTVGITGSATRSISMSSGTITDTFTINAANATVNAPTSGTLTGDTMNVTNGTFVIGDGNVTLANSSTGMTIDGGTVTHSGSGTLDLSQGSLVMTSGSFTGGAGTVDTDEDFTLSGGIFTAPTGTFYVRDDWTHTAGGTFTHNNGTVEAYGNVQATFDVASTETFYNFTINKDSGTQMIVASGDTLTTNNQLTLTDGNLNTGTFNSDATISLASTFDGGTGTLGVTGSNTRSINLSAGTVPDTFTINAANATVYAPTSGTLTGDTMNVTSGTFVIGDGNVTLANSSTGMTIGGGTVTHSGSGTLDLSGGSLVMTSGTFTGGAGTVDTDEDFVLSGGTFTAPSGTFYVRDDWTHTAGGTFTHNSGTVELYQNTGSTIDVNSTETFNNLTINKSANNTQVDVANSDVLTVEGNFTVTVGDVDGANSASTISVEGNVDLDDIGTTNTIALTFSGGNTQTFTAEAGDEAKIDGVIKVNKSGGQVNLGFALDMDASNQHLTIEEGTFDLNGNDITVNGTSATFTVEDGGNLQLQGTEIITANSSYPSFASGATATYDATSGTNSIKDYAYVNLTINGSGGTFQLAGNEAITGDLTVTNGTFDANNFTFGVDGNTTINGGTMKTDNGAITFGDAGGDSVTISSGELQIESTDTSNITINGSTWTNSGGTITYNSAGSNTVSILSAMSPYNDLVVNSSSSTHNLQANTDVNNHFTLSAGTVDATASDYDLTIGGNWANSGTFTARAATVTFDTVATTSVISGETTFYDFTSTTAGKNITFTAGTTQTIGGTLTLTGSTGNLITLRSSSPGTQWTVDQTSSSVNFIDVQDGVATAQITHVDASNSVNTGNTVLWFEASGGVVTGTVTIFTPNGGEELTSGETYAITWTWTGGTNNSRHDIYYSTNAGSNYTLIETVYPNGNPEYDWTVPDVETDEGLVKIVRSESGSFTTIDTSNSTFSIASASTTAGGGSSSSDSSDTQTGTEETESTEEIDDAVLQDDGTFLLPTEGVSPYSGEIESVTQDLEIGDYVRSESYSTVYYLGEDGSRRPFFNATTYFTYEDSFDEVKTVTDATLRLFDLGSNMLPKAGSVLIKVQSDPSVYAIEEDDEGGLQLRHVPSEEIANTLYGPTWAAYIIDVEPTVMGWFTRGEEMTEDETLAETMKTRLELAALAA